MSGRIFPIINFAKYGYSQKFSSPEACWQSNISNSYVKCLGFNFGQAVRNIYADETATTVKSPEGNTGNTIGNIYIYKIVTIRKSFRSNVSHTVGNIYTDKIATTVKSQDTDTLYSIRDFVFSGNTLWNRQ